MVNPVKPNDEKTAEPAVTEELAAEHGLSSDEWNRLVSGLGRTPSYTELGMASVMWSEHCSYKSSRVHLKTLPTEGERVIIGPGENAGVVDIGDNQAVVFKMESHNHPSFIEPYQGAATGVGGICRDVFTMGARPIAVADCLRFGEPSHPRTNYLVNGVVAGVGGYGNSFGVPNIAGDVAFDKGYNGNILVNAFCLGLAPADRIFLGSASGVGNPILYVGAKTGRDGIHGATMASAEFADDSEAKRPTVQVGDPFMEKLLLEACLELMQSDVIVGIQDMGAAGLTSSSVEMAARAGSGVILELDKVPMRERAMIPYELMLSESQERMLLVAQKGREQEVMEVFEKWDLDCAIVGRVTESGKVIVKMHGDVYADLPSDLLADGVVYERPFEAPAPVVRSSPSTLPPASDVESSLLALLSSPNVASKQWVFRQYDYNVRHGTVLRPGASGAGVVRVLTPDRSRAKGVAITAGCAGRYVACEPYQGTKLVVAEAYANLVAVGAQPLAVTNCLNFGNPERPEIMWQLAESIRGLGDACRMLGTPVISGNVSLYNETDGVAIRPTPMIAMVGLIDELTRTPTRMAFRNRGDSIALIIANGEDPWGELAGSEFVDHFSRDSNGSKDGVDGTAGLRVLSEKHLAVFETVRQLVASGVVESATDVSDGGLLVTIAEAVAVSELGAEIVLPASIENTENADANALFFGEGPARFVVSYSAEMAASVRAACAGSSVTLIELGEVKGDALVAAVAGTSAGTSDLAREGSAASAKDVVRIPVARLATAFSTGFATAVGLA